MHTAAKMVREEELLRLLLSGYMLKQCAVYMKMSYHTVRQYARGPEFLTKLKGLSTEIYERVDEELKSSKDTIIARLEEASDDALTEMISLAKTSANPIVKLKACQDIMDRDTRVSRTKRIEGTQSHDFVNPLFLVHAAATAREVEKHEREKRLESDTGDNGNS